MCVSTIAEEDYQLPIACGVCSVDTAEVFSGGGGILANMATCYSSYEIQQQPTSRTPQLQKDYTRPLHVDCSVEYELPNQAKPPVGVRNEPLLMIHPCYFRKIESQRRSPFVNNLPNRQQQIIAKRRIHQQHQAAQQQQQHRQHQAAAAVQQQQQHQQQQQQQQQQTAATHHHHLHHHQQQAAVTAAAQQHPQQQHQVPQPQAAAQYPVQFAATDRQQHQAAQQQQQLWEPLQPLPPLIPIAGQTYVNPTKRDPMLTAAYSSSTGSTDSGHWTDSDKSPEKTEEKHILSGKYRQYLRAHRLHPYVTSSIPLASTFPQIQQVCYNV